MSRNNKVNKDHYVQRGRLTPDEAARELAKMRQVGSQHTWQPTKKDALPRRESKDPAAGTETTEDKGGNEETSPEAELGQASEAATKKPATKSASMKANAAEAAPPTGRTAKAAIATDKTSGKAKAQKASKTAMKRTASAPKRKAVLARNVGGGGATPRAAKRRKS
jgi:hypothetical protein